MTPGAIFDETIETQEKLDQVKRSFAKAPLLDERNRPLHLVIYRLGERRTKGQGIALAIRCDDIAAQVAYDVDNECFVNAKDFPGGLRFDGDTIRHFISAAAAKSVLVRNPWRGDGSPEFIAMSQSSKNLSYEEAQTALQMAKVLGEQCGVTFTEPKKKPQSNHKE